MSSRRGKRAIASTGGLSNLILICFGATAKTGVDDGSHLVGGSVIVAPTGEIMVQAQSEKDEVIFCLAEHYQLIIDRMGAGEPLGKPPKD